MKPYEPPVFPRWTGKVSPLLDPRARDLLDPMPGFAHRHLWIWTVFIVSGFLWAGIFALFNWAVAVFDPPVVQPSQSDMLYQGAKNLEANIKAMMEEDRIKRDRLQRLIDASTSANPN